MWALCFTLFVISFQKENDNLNISANELEVFLSHKAGGTWRNATFTVHNITNIVTHSIIRCSAKQKTNSNANKIDKSMVKVYVSKNIDFFNASSLIDCVCYSEFRSCIFKGMP